MTEISTVGPDLAKTVFQIHAVDATGAVVVRRQAKRARVLRFFSRLRPCPIGMEACAGAHHRAREVAKPGHEVRPIPPLAGGPEPFAIGLEPMALRWLTAFAGSVCQTVRQARQDRPGGCRGHLRRFGAGRAAIERSGGPIEGGKRAAAQTRPSMRFVPAKTEARQAVPMRHRVGDFPVRRPTRLANALRAHLGEVGIVVPKGVHDIGRLIAAAEEAELPAEARLPPDLLASRFRDTKQRIDEIAARIRAVAETNETARRLQTLVAGSGLARMKCSGRAFQPERGPESPGIGPITASVPAATLPDVAAFRRARDLFAGKTSHRIVFLSGSPWLGLTPKPHSSGGKERLGSISKMGNRCIRRLLYLGAMGVISVRRRSDPVDDWLGRLIATKPMKGAAIALANRMARAIRAMLKKGETWRAA